tara:strand:- start:258 stop:647 length:390 start_codon:yes stop_codon:yes gene_type:complete
MLRNATLFVCLLTIIPIGGAADHSAQRSDYIYWIEPTKIRRANFDGTGAMDVVTGLVDGFGITLDPTGANWGGHGGFIYWTDNYSGPLFVIRRADLDGSRPLGLLSNGFMAGITRAYDTALDLTNSYIY